MTFEPNHEETHPWANVGLECLRIASTSRKSDLGLCCCYDNDVELDYPKIGKLLFSSY